MRRKRGAGGCLGTLLMLAFFCGIIVLGAKMITSHIDPGEILGDLLGREDRAGADDRNTGDRIYTVPDVKSTADAADKKDPVDTGRESITDIVPDTGGYTTDQRDASDIHRGGLLLVNADTPYRFQDDTDIVSLYDFKSNTYKVADKNVLVARDITGPLNRLFDDFYAACRNDDVIVISGYRTYEHQESLYNERVDQLGVHGAGLLAAQPGNSEHHMGLAVDLSIYHDDGTGEAYTGAGDYAWINQNAYRYGFVVRYDASKREITGISDEPWHFRYVGIPHAYVMAQKGFCYEEYIAYLRGYSYGEKHLLVVCGGRAYEIYFTKDTQVPIPKDREYSVSGNNVDGFIVTVAY